MSSIDPIEQQTGVTRGQPMDVQSALEGTNPNYDPLSPQDDPYKNNCQRCVPAYELRRRGYDVEALPKPTGEDIIESNVFTFDAFVDRYGNIMSYTRSTQADLMRQLGSFPDGSRFAVRNSWRGGGGHVYVAEKQNGAVSFYDPQDPSIDAATYITSKDAWKFGYMRINEAEFNPNIPLSEIVRG